MHQIMEWISSLASYMVEHWGTAGIFAGMLLESACIPIPSEVIMLVGGFYAAEGTLDFWQVFAAGTAGNVAGSILVYYIGASGARKVLERYGKYVLIHSKHIAKADAWFARYGGKAAFFGRLLPVVRTFISLPAGICKMNISRFVLYTLLGCLTWNLALTYLGFQLHEQWQVVETFMHPFSYAVAGLVLVYACWLLLRKIRGEKIHR
ncbi:DedA family protein [Paenibacillus sp. MBLB4367]|uniref:DedA family protein n=1 Tax=Paenibacillus sp. MBLB4367 TaxID=3384767 RepID=UPI0039080980